MRAYHDEEWGVPQHDPRMLWEMLMLEGFQAGLSWSTILRKREGVPQGLRRLQPEEGRGVRQGGHHATDGRRRHRPRPRQDRGDDRRRADLLRDGEARRDASATSAGRSRTARSIKRDGRSRIVTSPLSEEISKELKRRGFKFVGPTIVYAWMQAVGIVNDHAAGCFRRSQV